METALRELTAKIEKVMSEKEDVLGALIYIEGAEGYVSFAAIRDPASQHRMASLLTNWLIHILE